LHFKLKPKSLQDKEEEENKNNNKTTIIRYAGNTNLDIITHASNIFISNPLISNQLIPTPIIIAVSLNK